MRVAVFFFTTKRNGGVALATTRIIPMHKNKGKPTRQCLRERLAYAMNPSKTRNGELVKSYGCNPRTADAEWALTQRIYHDMTQREYKNEVIAYQVRQSFKPGEVTPEEANAIGVEFAKRFLKGRYAFVVSTHTDRHHIHNHILWNAISLDHKRKFRNFYRSDRAVARLSDQLCTEHKLSVILDPQRKGIDYGTWLGDDRKISQRELLRMAIDAAVQKKPDTFDALLQLLQEDDWEIKSGKRISLRKKGQQRFARLDSLGDGYDEQALRTVIAGQKTHTPRKVRQITAATVAVDRIGLLIDIEAAIKSGKGVGFEHWAEKENFQRAARSVRLLLDNGVDHWADVDGLVTDAASTQKELLDQCHALEQQIQGCRELRMHIINYSKTRKVADAYRQSGYSKKFAAEHADELRMFREAKKAFAALGADKLPKVAELQQQEHSLKQKKQELYTQYRKARHTARNLSAAQANVARFFQEIENPEERIRRDSERRKSSQVSART